MNGTSDKQGTGADPGLFSPGDAVKAVTKAEHQHHVQCLRGQGVLGGCVPLRSGKKCIFETQFARFELIWCIPFGNILLKNSFRINYWLHYPVSSFSHLSCFDAFARFLL